MNTADELRQALTEEPTVTFGVDYEVEGEVVGPMKPKSVQYGAWTWNFSGAWPMLTFNFNKYRPDLPPWYRVRETFLAAEDGTCALFEISHHLDTLISGKLKSVSLAALAPRAGEYDGDIISQSDVLTAGSGGSKSTSDFRVDEVLE